MNSDGETPDPNVVDIHKFRSEPRSGADKPRRARGRRAGVVTDVSGGGGGDGARGERVGGGSSDFRAGQNLLCKVSHAEPGGYAVLLTQYNLSGFLPTEISLKPGQEVLAQYVCRSDSRILLQIRFGHNAKPKQETEPEPD